MKFNLNLIALLSAVTLVSAVAVPDVVDIADRQIICTGLPLGSTCTWGNQCCGWPTNGCFGFPGGAKTCQRA